MLVFTMESGDVFHIGDEILVRIIKLDGGHVRVGIEAPRSLEIDRDKVRKRKLKEVAE